MDIKETTGLETKKEHLALPAGHEPKRIAAAPPPKKRHGWIWLLLLCVIAVGAYFYVGRLTKANPANKSDKNGKNGKGDGKGGPARAIPVVGATAIKGNMGVYLTGLGTVTAFNTVTVRTRVDGELIKVAFQEGQIVNKGDLLAEIDPRPYQVMLEQAEGTMAKDEANLKNAKMDLARYQVLFGQDAVPKQQLDTQVSTVNQAEGTLKSDQAAIDNAKLLLVYCRITSPLTGRIGLRAVDQGNMVHAADANGLAVITQLQPIAVLFNIAEDRLPQVANKVRAGAQLPVEAWDRDFTKKLANGALLTIDNQVDQSTGTVRFKGQFANQDNALFPNQFVNAKLLADTKRNVVIIPSAALQRSPDGTFVYAVKPDSTVEVRNVVTSLTDGDLVAVDSGLEEGAVVVTDGVDKLTEGALVSVRKPNAATPAGKSGGRSGGGAKGAGGNSGGKKG